MKQFFRLGLGFAAMAAALPGTAHAGACEDSFEKKGSPVTGLRFIARISVPDLPPRVAIDQMHGLVSAKGYDIMAEEGEYGSMLIEQPMSGKARAFPIEIKATSDGKTGTVVMEAKLRAGVFAGADGAKAEMCSVLNQLVGGKAGLAAAKKLRAAGPASATAAPVSMLALSFSHQVSKDTERNETTVAKRYLGKSYTINGTALSVNLNNEGRYVVMYDIPDPWNEVLRLPNTAPFKTDILCVMAPGTTAYAMQLKKGKSIKLTGTVFRLDTVGHTLVMKDCRPA